jgi:pyrimidine operon attenuation protein/uracil phosphoribosyltransferase
MPHPRTVAPTEIHAAIARLAAAIAGRHPPAERVLLLGVANGGIVLAQRLGAALPARAGVLDISFHRDDIGRHPIPKEFTPTLVPGDIQGAGVILVDDVLYTGRTVKAALDELFDHGRPAWVELAVLVDRGGRRLPVAADYVGLRLAAGAGEKVIVALDNEAPSRDKITVTRSM